MARPPERIGENGNLGILGRNGNRCWNRGRLAGSERPIGSSEVLDGVAQCAHESLDAGRNTIASPDSQRFDLVVHALQGSYDQALALNIAYARSVQRDPDIGRDQAEDSVAGPRLLNDIRRKTDPLAYVAHDLPESIPHPLRAHDEGPTGTTQQRT